MASARSASLKAQTVVSSRVSARPTTITKMTNRLASPTLRMMSTQSVTDQEFDDRYVEYFDRADIDGWEIRKGMSDLVSMDLVPDPTIVAAALRACRRLNDISLTTRILEIIKVKCGDKEAEIWPYMIQELQPTLAELGIPTPGDLGYDQPELALPNPYELH